MKTVTTASNRAETAKEVANKFTDSHIARAQTADLQKALLAMNYHYSFYRTGLKSREELIILVIAERDHILLDNVVCA